MYRFLLISFAIACLSIQWNSTPSSLNWRQVYYDMHPEFLRENIRSIKEDQLLSIPIDLQKKISASETVILVDYRLPSDKKRLWVVKNKKILVHCRVAHGKNSGETMATSFSNQPESNKSCLGEFITGKIYIGEKGLAMRLHGIEKGVNDLAYERGIVFHSGNYVSTNFLLINGRIGRSFGCFVTTPFDNYRILTLCRNGARLFVSGHQQIKF